MAEGRVNTVIWTMWAGHRPTNGRVRQRPQPCQFKPLFSYIAIHNFILNCSVVGIWPFGLIAKGIEWVCLMGVVISEDTKSLKKEWRRVMFPLECGGVHDLVQSFPQPSMVDKEAAALLRLVFTSMFISISFLNK